MMSNGFLSYNSGELYYETEGHGTPLVFLHGFSLDRRMWKNQIAYFSKNYRVITYDLRGFGRSSVPVNSYSHFDDLHALLNHLQINKTHIIGLSMGGEAAIDFVITYPSFVKSLTTINSSLGGFPCSVDWDIRAQKEGLDRGKQNWLNHAVFEHTRKNPKASQALKEMVGDYSGWKWFHNDPRNGLEPNSMSRIEDIKVPTLVIVGEKDLTYFKDTADFLVSKIKNAQKITIPDAGHMPNMENAGETNRLMDEFFRNKS